jgi:hypothetical protein
MVVRKGLEVGESVLRRQSKREALVCWVRVIGPEAGVMGVEHGDEGVWDERLDDISP